MFKIILLLTAWVTAIMLSASGMEFGIDNFGRANELSKNNRKGRSVAADTFAGSTRERSIHFKNNYDEPITLHWIGDGEDVRMGEIAAASQASYNSFTGHAFFATSSRSGRRLEPAQVKDSNSR